MTEIKVEFENMWKRFDPERFIEKINSSLKNVRFKYDGVRSDLVISGCYENNSPPITHKPRLLFVTENLSLKHYSNLVGNTRYTKKMGYTEDNRDSCSVLDWFFNYERLKNVELQQIEQRHNSVCHVMYNITKRREELIETYHSESLDLGSRFDLDPDERTLEKVEEMKQYTYNLCPENSVRSGYITEKIVDCILAGCVPIYEGGDLESYTPFNLDRVVWAGDELPQNHAEIFSLPIFNENHKEMFEERRERIESFILNL